MRIPEDQKLSVMEQFMVGELIDYFRRSRALLRLHYGCSEECSCDICLAYVDIYSDGSGSVQLGNGDMKEKDITVPLRDMFNFCFDEAWVDGRENARKAFSDITEWIAEYNLRDGLEGMDW